MILWNDGRSSAETQRIRTAKPRAWWRARLLNEWTPAGLGRLAWMRRHHKTVFDDARLLHVGAGEYLFHRLTGLWRQDAGNAIQIGSYNAARGALTGDMLALAGFSVDRVAPLRAGHETAPLSADFARAAALRAGIPVVGPYIDQEAALQSVQGVGARPLQCSLGTAWVGNFSLPARAVGAAAMQFVLRGGDARARTVVLPLLTGNTAWDWALSRFVDADPRKALCAAEELLAAQLLPPAGMVCVPWLLQGNPEGAQEAGACTFHGVGPRATTHDFVRAVACGLCFELLRVFAQAKEGKRVDAVILSGGASKSARFRELISTLFAPLPAYVQQNEDTAAARGALIAFSDRMAKSPVSRIAAARGARARAITDAYRQYLRVFATVYGDHPLAAPYAFTKEGK